MMNIKQYIKYTTTATLFALSSSAFGSSEQEIPASNVDSTTLSSQKIEQHNNMPQVAALDSVANDTEIQAKSLLNKKDISAKLKKTENKLGKGFFKNPYVRWSGSIVIGLVTTVGIGEGVNFYKKRKKKNEFLNGNTDEEATN